MIALLVAGALAGELSLLGPQGDLFQADGELEVGCAGIGGGKTHVGALKTIVRAINIPTARHQCHAVVSPTYPMLELGPLPKLLELLEDPEIFPVSPLVAYRVQKRCLYIKNRFGSLSRIRMFSAEKPDRFRGDEWLSVWMDEADYYKKNVLGIALGRLARRNGPATVTTSPDGHGLSYDVFQKCDVVEERDGYEFRRSADGRTIFVRWSALKNVFVSERGYERLRESYDPDTFEQEVNAGFVAKSGRVYSAFKREKHVCERPFNPRGRIIIGQDFNVDPLAGMIMQHFPGKEGGSGGLHVHEEIALRNANTHQLAESTKEWCRRMRVPTPDGERFPSVTFYADASARKRTTAADDATRTDLRILERAGFKVEANRANPRVKDRVNCVNGLLYNGRLTVGSKCSNLVTALEKQAWKDGEPEKDGWDDNFNDALGYGCWGIYPLTHETTLGKVA